MESAELEAKVLLSGILTCLAIMALSARIALCSYANNVTNLDAIFHLRSNLCHNACHLVTAYCAGLYWTPFGRELRNV